MVNKITINGQSYDSPESMPPDVRRMYDDALRAAGAIHGKPGFHVSVNVSRPEVRSFGDSSTAATSRPLPIEASSTESDIRGLVWTVAFFVLGGLALLFFWAR